MTRKARRGHELATFVRGRNGIREGVEVYPRYVFNGLNGNEKRCGLAVVKGGVDWKLRVTIARGG